MLPVSASRVVAPARRLLDRMTISGAPDRPVFVGACPRSGTTMLRTMLNSHPDVAIPRETRFLLETFHRRAEFGDLRVDANRRRLAETIVYDKDSWFGRFEVDRDMAMDRLMTAPPTFGSVVGTAFKLYAERDGKTRWGDKRPTLVLYLPGIFSMFPDAQFINIVRDPRAAAASMKKLEWYDGSVAGGVELWLSCVQAARKATQRMRPDQIHNIQYEELVRAPADVLHGVARFLNLQPDGVDTMLSFHQNVDEPVSEYHNKLDQPVTDAPVEGWRDTLSADEIAFIEHKTGEWMDEYGYERTAGSVPVPDSLLQEFAKRRKRRQRGMLGKTKTALTYRYPVAARITSGQQRRYRVTRPFVQVRTKAAAGDRSART